MTRLAKRVSGTVPRLHKSFKVNALFSVCKMMHQGVLKSEDRPSLDNQFFLDKGWIRDKR